jgi:hypothetical protein
MIHMNRRVVLILITLLLIVSSVPLQLQAAIPGATTNDPTGVQTKNATLHGYIDDGRRDVRYQYYTTNDDSFGPVTGTIWCAQTFNVTTPHYINYVKLLVYRIGSPGTVTVSIRATDMTGNITGADLTSGTTNGNNLSTISPFTWRKIAVSPYYLAARTRYAIVVRATAGDGSNELCWRDDTTSPTYTGGSFMVSATSGVTWIVDSSKDSLFEEYGSGVNDSGKICTVGFEYYSTDYIVNRINLPESFIKQTNPTTLPPYTANGVAFSPNGTLLAVAHETSPYVSIYRLGATNGTWYKMRNPTTLPEGDATSVAFSPNGTLLAVGTIYSPCLVMYRRGPTNGTFYKIPGPTGVAGAPYDIKFSPDGVYMAVGHQDMPRLTIYKRGATNGTYYKLQNPTTLPSSNVNGVAFSHNGTYLAASFTFSPYLLIYKKGAVNGTYYREPNNPTTVPGAIQGLAFSHNSTYLAAGSYYSPYVIIYKRGATNGTYYKLPNPATLPTNAGWGVAFSNDSIYLSVAHYNYPYLTIYRRGATNGTYYKLPNPATLPANVGQDVAFSRNDTYLAVAHAMYPYVTIYKTQYKTGDAFIYNLTNLKPGQFYNYRAYVNNSNGSSAGVYKQFLVKPNSPSSCSGSGYNRTQVNLSWTNYVRSNKTIIVRKAGSSYPSSLTDGTIIYNGTGTSYHDTNLTDGITYRYGFWSWRSWNYSTSFRQLSSIKNTTSATTTSDIIPRLANMSATSDHVGQKIFLNVTYSDTDDGAPEQIRARMWLGATIYNESMTWKSGSNYTGAHYSHNRTFSKGGLWSVKFQAFDGMHWNETAPLTFAISYNISFGINFPSYLSIGDYILTFGTLANGTIPLNNVWAYTKVVDNANVTIPFSARPFYVVNGLYMYSFSTSTMLPGIYTICLNVTVTGMNMIMNQTLYLSYSGGESNPGPGHIAAKLFYTFFHQNTGMQLADDLYKMYISITTSFTEDNRVKYGTYETYTGQTLYYQVKDYWGNLVYPGNGTTYSSFFISSTGSYLDIGIAANEFLVKNSNDSIIYFRLTNGPLNGTGNTWYSSWIPPQESAKVFMRTGIYNFTLRYYDPMTRALTGTKYVNDFYIDSDIFYWVPGYRLGDIVISLYNVNSSLLNQLINVGVYVNNVNSTVLNQAISSSIWLQNLNATIANQLIYMVQNISNWNTTIKNQWIAAIQNITNMRANITNQIISVDQHIMNLNSNIVNQSNLIRQQILNLNTTLNVQINGVLQNITNVLSNITYQGNLVGQWITNLRTNITEQFNMVVQQVENINGTIYEQANIADQLILNSKSLIIAQINAVWQAVNNTNATATLNETQLHNLNITGFDSLMIKLRAILDQFQLPHSWQIPKVDYTINDTTPPISTITAYVAADGSLQVSYGCTDNSVFGVAYVNLYYKIGTNASYWRNWSFHAPQTGTKTFNGETPKNGTTYWFRCLGTDVFGNVEQPSDTNTMNITFFYTAPAAVGQILPVDTTTVIYTMALLIICIILLALYSVYRRRKEEKQMARRTQGPRQPLH